MQYPSVCNIYSVCNQRSVCNTKGVCNQDAYATINRPAHAGERLRAKIGGGARRVWPRARAEGAGTHRERPPPAAAN